MQEESTVIDIPIDCDLPLSEWQKKIFELAETSGVGHGRHYARHAVRHLQKAWRIRAVDAEMAAFRSYAAEEEAAAAVITSLQRLKYDGASKLRSHSHIHKNAIYPFMIAVSHELDEYMKSAPFDFSHEITRAGGIQLGIKWKDGRPPLISKLPLELRLFMNDELCDFSDGIQKLAGERKISSIAQEIKRRARRRNALLYADPRGCPTASEAPDRIILLQRDMVSNMLQVYLLIDPFPKQIGCQQLLDAFLKVIAKLRE